MGQGQVVRPRNRGTRWAPNTPLASPPRRRPAHPRASRCRECQPAAGPRIRPGTAPQGPCRLRSRGWGGGRAGARGMGRLRRGPGVAAVARRKKTGGPPGARRGTGNRGGPLGKIDRQRPACTSPSPGTPPRGTCRRRPAKKTPPRPRPPAPAPGFGIPRSARGVRDTDTVSNVVKLPAKYWVPPSPLSDRSYVTVYASGMLSLYPALMAAGRSLGLDCSRSVTAAGAGGGAAADGPTAQHAASMRQRRPHPKTPRPPGRPPPTCWPWPLWRLT